MIQMWHEGWIDCQANYITESDEGWLCGVIYLFMMSRFPYRFLLSCYKGSHQVNRNI